MTEIVERRAEAEAQAHDPRTPYVGLVPYGEADAPFFFGRDERRAIVTANLRAARLTILYGPSGVGKTSLLLAGVVHQLRVNVLESAGTRRDRAPAAVCVFRSWRDEGLSALMESIRTGAAEALGGEELEPWRPGDSVTETLRRWNRSVRTFLVVLDQFEDYFLYHPDEDGDGTLAAELPRIVNDPTLRVNVLISIREDAWARLDRFKGRIPHLFANYVRVEHLSVKAAQQAIEEPLEEWNRRLPPGEEPFRIEPDLVTAVLKQVRAGRVVLEQSGHGTVEGADSEDGEEQVETAYLQLVMTRLWHEERRRASRVLRLETLDELGGAQTIVRTHLDDALGALTPAQQDLIADLFNHLVTPSGTKIAHTPADLAVYTRQPLEAIVDVLETLSGGQTRILRPVSAGDGPARYEIFHDVLAAAVLDWRTRRIRGRLEREREYAEAQARHERRRARVFRALAVWAVIAMAIAGALAVVVWQRSEEQARTDESREIAASARDLLDRRLDLAIPLALEAYERADTVEARSALLAATHRTARLVRVMRPDGRRQIWGAAFDPTGVHLATVGDGGLAVWDRAGRNVARPVTEKHVSSFAFSPRGDLVVASGAGGLTLWDTTTWNQTKEILAAPNATSVEVSADGRAVAGLNGDGLVILSLPGGRSTPARWPTGEEDVQNVAFSPTDPALLAVVAGRERRVELWNIQNGRRIPAGPANVDALAFSRDGRLLALAGSDQRIQLWSVARRTVLGDARGGQAGAIVSLAFSADGKTLASGATDRSVILWDISQPEAPQRIGAPLRVRAEVITRLAFADNLLAVTSVDGTVVLWDARHRTPVGSIYSRQFPSRSVLSPDARLLASFDEPSARTSIWQVGTSRKESIDAAAVSVPVAFTGDGSKLLTVAFTGSDERFRLWDVGTGRAADLQASVPADGKIALSRGGSLATATASAVELWDNTGKRLDWTGTKGTVREVAVTEDATRLAWGYQDGRVAIWHRLDEDAPRVIQAHEAAVTTLSFSRDGQVLAVASEDSTISLWDVGSAQTTGSLVGHSELVDALAFSADGETLASGASDSTIRLWDVGTRRPLGEALATPTPVSSVAFGLRSLVALTSDGSVVVWDKSFWSIERKARRTLQKRLCALIGQIDQTEWQNVLPEKSPHQPCAAATERGSK